MSKTVNVSMIGLGFGAEFPSIRHIPRRMCTPSAAVARPNCTGGDRFDIEKRFTSYDDVLADPDIDFVHINSPIPDHAWMSLRALDAGKHVMSTVPMATTIDECRQIVEKVKETGLKYMMAETVVYSREFLFIKELYDNGELGRIQHLAASHPQDMDGWPEYWERMIPMQLCHSRRQPLPGTGGGTGRIRELLRLGHRPRRHRREIRQSLRPWRLATSRSRTPI